MIGLSPAQAAESIAAKQGILTAQDIDQSISCVGSVIWFARDGNDEQI